MSAAQLYFLLAPIVLLLVVGGGVGIWMYATRDDKRRRAR
jgi:hypothetical protein